MTMRPILFQGKLPGFLGFDRGPYELAGVRATVLQSQVFHSRGRFVAVTPTYRMVTDMAEEVIHTTRCGGPGFRVQGSGFRVQGSGFRDCGTEP
jgi:penicillin amidase